MGDEGVEVFNFKNEIFQYVLNKGVRVEELASVTITSSAPLVGVKLNNRAISIPVNQDKFCEITIGENVTQK